MKLPLIKQFYQNATAEELQHTADVLEKFTEFRGVSEAQEAFIGEILTDIFGAIEVHREVAAGKPEKEALNGFAQKVLGSIDRS